MNVGERVTPSETRVEMSVEFIRNKIVFTITVMIMMIIVIKY